jgi:hypothetical protein
MMVAKDQIVQVGDQQPQVVKAQGRWPLQFLGALFEKPG